MIKEQGSSVKRLIQWINRSAERADCGRGLPQARHQPREFLQAEGQIWRDGGVGCPAPKQLEEENAKLKRLVADTMLDVVVLKDLLGKR